MLGYERRFGGQGCHGEVNDGWEQGTSHHCWQPLLSPAEFLSGSITDGWTGIMWFTWMMKTWACGCAGALGQAQGEQMKPTPQGIGQILLSEKQRCVNRTGHVIQPYNVSGATVSGPLNAQASLTHRSQPTTSWLLRPGSASYVCSPWIQGWGCGWYLGFRQFRSTGVGFLHQ